MKNKLISTTQLKVSRRFFYGRGFDSVATRKKGVVPSRLSSEPNLVSLENSRSLGRHYDKQNEWEKAEAAYKKSMKSNPTGALYLDMLMHYFARGKKDDISRILSLPGIRKIDFVVEGHTKYKTYKKVDDILTEMHLDLPALLQAIKKENLCVRFENQLNILTFIGSQLIRLQMDEQTNKFEMLDVVFNVKQRASSSLAVSLRTNNQVTSAKKTGSANLVFEKLLQTQSNNELVSQIEDIYLSLLDSSNGIFEITKAQIDSMNSLPGYKSVQKWFSARDIGAIRINLVDEDVFREEFTHLLTQIIDNESIDENRENFSAVVEIVTSPKD